MSLPVPHIKRRPMTHAKIVVDLVAIQSTGEVDFTVTTYYDDQCPDDIVDAVALLAKDTQVRLERIFDEYLSDSPEQ